MNSVTMTSGGGAASFYGRHDAQQAAHATPKEIGVLQRAAGINGGLQEIHGRLATFVDRVSGAPSAPNNPVCGPPAGLPGALSECEETIRKIIALISSLEQTF